MLKKFFVATFLLLMMSATCAAMNFQQPVEIGSVSVTGGSGIKISGATNINATEDSAHKSYVKGSATFEKLYLHFDAETLAQKARVAKTSADMLKIYAEVSFFGGSDVKNSVPYFVFEGMTKIYRIDNDAGLAMYLLSTETGGGGSMTVIGERDGKWDKYFDTSDAKKTYGIPRNFYLSDFSAAGDEIIFRYRLDNTETYRELHYRWDDSEQWFSVEQR